MQLDYNLLLDNVKRRRFDEAIRDHILSSSFSDQNIPECARYALESMQEIDQGYTYKVYANTRKIEGEISKGLRANGVKADVRYQGPLRTDTHIRLYGEIDMMFILDEGASSKEVYNLGQAVRGFASTQNHQSVDYSSGLKIQLITEKPACKINIIPACWINNPKYMEKRNEIYRGVAIYNFKTKTKKKNLPFLNMARVNVKDQNTDGNLKATIRLLKSLTVDHSIKLDTNELIGMAYQMEDSQLKSTQNASLAILPAVEGYIKNLLGDAEKFDALLSPGEKELVFGARPDRKEAVSKLHAVLSSLVADLKEKLGDLRAPIEYHVEPPDHSDSE